MRREEIVMLKTYRFVNGRCSDGVNHLDEYLKEEEGQEECGHALDSWAHKDWGETKLLVNEPNEVVEDCKLFCSRLLLMISVKSIFHALPIKV